MKLQQAIDNVIKSPSNKSEVFLQEFAECYFDIPIGWVNEEDTLLTCYYLSDWICTDIKVGYRVYFFDDKPVAISTQIGRKYSETIQWISRDCYNIVKNHILSFLNDDDLPIVDLDEDIDDGYGINYYDQLLPHHKVNVIYDSQRVSIIDRGKSISSKDTAIIRYNNGETETILLSKLRFIYNVKSTI